MRGDILSGLFSLFVSIYIVREGVSLDVGGLHQPGPGFFPLFGGILLGIFSIALLLRSTVSRSEQKGGKKEVGKENLMSVVYIFIGLLVYTFILDWLGFILCTFLLLAILLKVFDRQEWWKVLVTAGIASSASYIIFAVLLKSPLPRGILEIFL